MKNLKSTKTSNAIESCYVHSVLIFFRNTKDRSQCISLINTSTCTAHPVNISPENATSLYLVSLYLLWT